MGPYLIKWKYFEGMPLTQTNTQEGTISPRFVKSTKITSQRKPSIKIWRTFHRLSLDSRKSGSNVQIKSWRTQRVGISHLVNGSERTVAETSLGGTVIAVGLTKVTLGATNLISHHCSFWLALDNLQLQPTTSLLCRQCGRLFVVRSLNIPRVN